MNMNVKEGTSSYSLIIIENGTIEFRTLIYKIILLYKIKIGSNAVDGNYTLTYLT